jgi:hypothetical protein
MANEYNWSLPSRSTEHRCVSVCADARVDAVARAYPAHVENSGKQFRIMILLFLCRHSMKPTANTVASAIAKSLKSRGIAIIGTLGDLSVQHQKKVNERNPMLFLNDCSSSCMKVITARLDPNEYLYINVDENTTENQILDHAIEKWKLKLNFDFEITMPS